MSDHTQNALMTRIKTLLNIAICCTAVSVGCQANNETAPIAAEEENPGETNELIGVAQDILEAFNTNDWEAFTALAADGVVYDEVATSGEIEGADAIVESMKGWKTAMPDVKGTVNNAQLTDHGVLLEVTWVGTHTGPLGGPEGIPATGNSQTTRSAWIMEFDEGKLSRSRHYFDMLSLMQQLGVIP